MLAGGSNTPFLLLSTSLHISVSPLVIHDVSTGQYSLRVCVYEYTHTPRINHVGGKECFK